jgi:hypothetical protein
MCQKMAYFVHLLRLLLPFHLSTLQLQQVKMDEVSARKLLPVPPARPSGAAAASATGDD